MLQVYRNEGILVKKDKAMEIGDMAMLLGPIDTEDLMGDPHERVQYGIVRAKRIDKIEGTISYRVSSDPDPCSKGFDINLPHWSSWRDSKQLGAAGILAEIDKERIGHAIHEIMQNGQHDGDSMEEKVMVLDKVLKILAGKSEYDSLSFYNGNDDSKDQDLNSSLIVPNEELST